MNLDWGGLQSAILDAKLAIQPWRAFVGLIKLCMSPYIPRGQVFAINPPSYFREISLDAVWINGEDHEEWRTLGLSDDELSAFLWWHIQRQAKP